MRCAECGAEIGPDDEFCHACGGRITQENPKTDQIQRGRLIFITSFIYMAGLPLISYFVSFYASYVSQNKIAGASIFDAGLAIVLSFLYYMGFKGSMRAKKLIIIYAFLSGGIMIASSLVFVIFAGIYVDQFLWIASGIISLWIAFSLKRSPGVDLYIESRRSVSA